MKEADIQREVMMELSRLGATIWRNNTGVLKDSRGVPVRFGLCVGSSDIIGLYQGRFLAVEVKTPQGKVTKKQKKFLDLVIKNGGIAFIARGKEDVEYCLTKFAD